MNEQPPPKRRSVIATVLLTLIIAAVIVADVVMAAKDDIIELDRPVATTIRAQEQMLTLAQVGDGGIWARLRGWVMDLPVRPLETAADAYRRALPAAGGSDAGRAVALHARRAVVLSALGQVTEARAELAATAALSSAGAVTAAVVAHALAVPGDDAGERPSPDDLEKALAALAIPGVPPAGWTADQIRIGFARRAGSPAELAAARAAEADRTGRLVARADGLTLVEVAIGAAALLVLVVVRMRRQRLFPPLADAALPTPWTPGEAYAVSVRGLAPAMAAAGVLSGVLAALGLDGTGLAFLVAAAVILPVLRRGLLAPRGLRWAPTFGLRPRTRWRTVLASALLLVAVQLLLGWSTDVVGLRLGRQSPWTERLAEPLFTGNAFECLSMLGAMVVGAPLLEETAFRGILYGTLRTRLGIWPSALVSAVLFALAHGYSGIGTLTIFLGALLWTLVYERTRSLLPSILDHAANNALAAVSDLLLR